MQVFRSHAEADRAEADYYASLNPIERVEMLLELVARHRESLGEAASRFERVCTVVERSQR